MIRESSGEEKTKIGDWVEAKESGSYWDGLIGYIEDARYDQGQFLFRAVRHRTRGAMVGCVWTTEHFFKPLQEGLTQSDVDALIDWSLDEKDEETFRRLVAIREVGG